MFLSSLLARKRVHTAISASRGEHNMRLTVQRQPHLFQAALLLSTLLAAVAPADAQWTTLNNSFGTTTHLDTCVLLTNGDVMCHEYASPNWHRRRPDNTG